MQLDGHNALARATDGDASALEALYRAFHPRVLALCRRLLADWVVAEDAAADVFARLPSALPRFDPARRPFASWLLAVAANLCIDRLRRRARERRIFVDDAPDPAGPDDPLATLLEREEQDRFVAAIEALPEKYRVPLVLRFQAEQSYAEIAQALDVELGQVASLLFRARARLRRSLAQGQP